MDTQPDAPAAGAKLDRKPDPYREAQLKRAFKRAQRRARQARTGDRFDKRTRPKRAAAGHLHVWRYFTAQGGKPMRHCTVIGCGRIEQHVEPEASAPEVQA